MSTSTVTRTTSSDTSSGDWLEEEGVVVKDEETLTELKTESSLSPTVERVIVDPFETGPAHFCQTVHLESLLFSESAFLHSKMMSRQNCLLLFSHFSYGLEGRI